MSMVIAPVCPCGQHACIWRAVKVQCDTTLLKHQVGVVIKHREGGGGGDRLMKHDSMPGHTN